MSSGRRGSPPKWARRILDSALPVGARGESIRGDLEAEYADFNGPDWLARLWFVVESFKLAIHYREWLRAAEIRQDIRYGVRMLRRTPLVTAVAVLSLAIGIAASTATFATAYGFLYAPLPYTPQADLQILLQVDRITGRELNISSGNVLDLADRVEAFGAVAAWRSYPTTMAGGDEPVQIVRLDATPNVFDVLGRGAAIGRTFAPDEGRAGENRVGVLTHRLWRSSFGSDPRAVGRVIDVAGRAVTIVGVMPPDFEFIPGNVGLVVANDLQSERGVREGAPVMAVTTLADGVTAGQARARTEAAWQRIASEYPDQLGRYDVRLGTLREQFPPEADARLVQIMLAVALCVLMVAAVNVVNLLMARAEERTQEIAVRTSLGASRLRIVRQLLTEGVLLVTMGAGVGVVLAQVGVDQLTAHWPAAVPHAFRPRAHPAVLAFAVTISMGVGLLFGLAPALQALRSNQRDGLKARSRGGTAGRAPRARTAFVVGEIAIAMALLVGAVSMTSFARAMVDVELGLRSQGLLTFRTIASGTRYDDPTELARFHRNIEEQLRALPRTTGVAIMDELPRGQRVPRASVSVPGRDAGGSRESRTTQLLSVNRSYFETMEIPLRKGRTFEPIDAGDAPPVTVVSETFADFHFPGERAIGRRITLRGQSVEIIGVVGDVFHSRVEHFGGLAGMAYLPLEQRPVRDVAYAVRTTGTPTELAPGLRPAVWAVDAKAAVSDVRTLDDFIAAEMGSARVLGRTMELFGILALLLSAMGVYGVMAHSVARRRREIGIRMALGAERLTVTGLVLRSGVRQAAAGLMIGLPLALFIRRAAQPIGAQFRAELGGPSIVVWVAAALGLVCLLASYLPARRAAGVDPNAVLRSD